MPIDINALAKSKLDASKQSRAAPIGARPDRLWIKYAFMIPFKADPKSGKLTPLLDDVDVQNMSFSMAKFKFTDSSLGGALCINPPPQYTRYADPPVKGIHPDARRCSVTYQKGTLGEGRYYSEAIDDNSQIIHLRFGVPSFNSLWQFFTGFYNGSLARLVRSGRVDQTFFEKVLQFAFKIVEVAILPLTILPMMIMAVGQAIRFMLRMPTSSFYTLKPTMPVYWHAVTGLVNMLAVNMKMVTYTQPEMYEQFIGEKVPPKHILSLLNGIFPEMTERGVPDMYLIATRAKRLQMRHRENLMRQLNDTGKGGWEGKIRRVLDSTESLQQIDARENLASTQKSPWERWIASPIHGQPKKSEVETDWRDPIKLPEKPAATANEKTGQRAAQTAASDANSIADAWNKTTESARAYVMKLGKEALEQVDAVAQDGAEWLSFRVDATGSMTESFSNSTAPSSLAEKMNSASQSARELKFNFADGNVDALGIVKTAVDGIASIATMGADLLHIGGLVSFAGSAFVDIPEHFSEAQANIKPSNYTFRLVSPHGNIVSQFLYIYIPLMCLLAGALPRAVGKQAYTDPFLVQLYDRGRASVRLGIIDSLTVQRGVSNLAFDKDGRAMAIDITLSIKDLSSIMSVPINPSLSINPFEGIFDDQNKFNDYMTTLAAIPLYEFDYRKPILLRQLDTKLADIRSHFSVPRMMMDLGGSLPGQIYSALQSYGTPKK